MNKFHKEILYKLEATIKELEIETECPIQQIESVTPIIIQYSDTKNSLLFIQI